MSSKRMKYSAKFKLQVVKFTQESNNCAAGCEFYVNEKLFHDLRKQVVKWKCMLKNKFSSRRKLVPVDWVRRQASSFEWRAKAECLHHHLQHDNHQDEGNGCWIADNWVPGFQLLVYDVPSKEESCSLTEDKDRSKASRRSWPEDRKLQLRNQEQKEGKLRTCSQWEHGQNAFLIWHAISQNHKCERYKNCVGQHNWFTVALVCLADGMKLKQMVIFKRKTLPEECFPPGVLVHCHLRGWMDEPEAMGRQSMPVTTWRPSEKERSPCMGLLPSSLSNQGQSNRAKTFP